MAAKALAASVLAVLATAGCASTKPTSTTRLASDEQALVWARCIRAHGVPDFPDPIAGHKAMFPDSAGTIMSSRSPLLLEAKRACQKVNPAPRGAASGPGASLEAAMLEYARCMRAHGVSNYPDPSYGKSGRPIVSDLSGQGIDTQSPAFIRAARVCNGHGGAVG